MSSNLSNKAKRRIIGRSFDWIQKFDPIDYLENRPMIEKLHEEKQLAVALNLDLETKLVQVTLQIRELELENQRLSSITNEKRRQSFIIFSISLLAIILISIGVNIATDQPNAWEGWVMIVASIFLEIIAFLVAYRKSE